MARKARKAVQLSALAHLPSLHRGFATGFNNQTAKGLVVSQLILSSKARRSAGSKALAP
jgi:hypothetical protein